MKKQSELDKYKKLLEIEKERLEKAQIKSLNKEQHISNKVTLAEISTKARAEKVSNRNLEAIERAKLLD